MPHLDDAFGDSLRPSLARAETVMLVSAGGADAAEASAGGRDDAPAAADAGGPRGQRDSAAPQDVGALAVAEAPLVHGSPRLRGRAVRSPILDRDRTMILGFTCQSHRVPFENVDEKQQKLHSE